MPDHKIIAVYVDYSTSDHGDLTYRAPFGIDGGQLQYWSMKKDQDPFDALEELEIDFRARNADPRLSGFQFIIFNMRR